MATKHLGDQETAVKLSNVSYVPNRKHTPILLQTYSMVPGTLSVDKLDIIKVISCNTRKTTYLWSLS